VCDLNRSVPDRARSCNVQQKAHPRNEDVPALSRSFLDLFSQAEAPSAITCAGFQTFCLGEIVGQPSRFINKHHGEHVPGRRGSPLSRRRTGALNGAGGGRTDGRTEGGGGLGAGGWGLGAGGGRGCERTAERRSRRFYVARKMATRHHVGAPAPTDKQNFLRARICVPFPPSGGIGDRRQTCRRSVPDRDRTGPRIGGQGCGEARANMSLAGRCVQFYRAHPGVPRISRSGDGRRRGEGRPARGRGRGRRGEGGRGRGWGREGEGERERERARAREGERRANMNSDNVLLAIGNATIISKAEASMYDNIVIP